jgi:hypothetical protein
VSTANTDPRLRTAENAYLSVYNGDWGLKASDEDAILAVIVAVYPKAGFTKDGSGIEKFRADDRLKTVSDWLYEFGATGAEESEIAAGLLERLDPIFGVQELPPGDPRTILMHLNISVPDSDPRNADEIGDLILGALEVGLEGAPGDFASGNEASDSNRIHVTPALCEEV